jgi:hypothetical protein
VSTFKKYEPTNEFLDMVKDPFRQGDFIWKKCVNAKDIAIVTIEASISGIDKNHTAIISVITSSLDNYGEELAKERLILHQKDFSSKDEAIKHLKEKEKEISYK